MVIFVKIRKKLTEEEQKSTPKSSKQIPQSFTSQKNGLFRQQPLINQSNHHTLYKSSICQLKENEDIQDIVQEYLEPGSTENDKYSPADPHQRIKNMRKVLVTATNMITLHNKVRANNAFFRNYYNLVSKISLDDNIQYISQMADEMLATPTTQNTNKLLCAPKKRKVFIHTYLEDKVKLVCQLNSHKPNKSIQRFLETMPLKQLEFPLSARYSDQGQFFSHPTEGKMESQQNMGESIYSSRTDRISPNLTATKSVFFHPEKIPNLADQKNRQGKFISVHQQSGSNEQNKTYGLNLTHRRNISEKILPIVKKEGSNQTHSRKKPSLQLSNNSSSSYLFKSSQLKLNSPSLSKLKTTHSSASKETLAPYFQTVSPTVKSQLDPQLMNKFFDLNEYLRPPPQLKKVYTPLFHNNNNSNTNHL